MFSKWSPKAFNFLMAGLDTRFSFRLVFYPGIIKHASNDTMIISVMCASNRVVTLELSRGGRKSVSVSVNEQNNTDTRSTQGN